MKEMKKDVVGNVRQFGQSSLTSSFLSKSKSRIPNEGTEPKASKKPISLSDFLNRKIGKNDAKSIKEKPSAFSSIGFDKRKPGSEKDEVGGGLVLDKALFKGFNQPVIKEGEGVEEFQSESNGDGDGDDSKKRKSPFGLSSGEDEKHRAKRYLVVLGDDPKPKPKPKPMRRERKQSDEQMKPFYNHYESGCGWWDDNREGVDSEEVGCNDVWEGMGSTTLGGLEWH